MAMPGGVAPMVFLGGITDDVVAAVPRYPGPDERVVASATTRAGGGPAATAAVAAARLGTAAVTFVGAVGDDEAGARLVAELAAEGVGTDGVVVVAGAATGSSLVTVDLGRGTRAICASPGPALLLDPATPQGRRATAVVRAARQVHVDHLGWSALTSVLDVADRAGRPPVSVDVSYDTPGFSLAGVDLHVPSLGGADVDATLDAAIAAGAACVVATRGPLGSVARCADGRRAAADGVAVEVASTLGAGDVFHGALLAALDRGCDLQGALVLANAVAAASCRALDGRSAVPAHPAGLDAGQLLDAVLRDVTAPSSA